MLRIVRKPNLQTPNAPPLADNKRGAIAELLTLNDYYRHNPWPEPYDATSHRLHLGDARDFSWIDDQSVHLIVTSPPYFTLKKYENNEDQLGEIQDYEQFLDELDKVWKECSRVLVPGGRICSVVGDVCVSRRAAGRHYILPLHADLQVRARSSRTRLPYSNPLVQNRERCHRGKVTEPVFMGSLISPAHGENDIEHILFFRKGGSYRSPQPIQKALSMLTKKEMQNWLVTAWTELRANQQDKSSCSISRAAS